MFKFIKNLIGRSLSNSKKSLFTFNNEPFSKFSILLIILLDVFLLMTILRGIDSEKSMAPTIYTKFPSQCQNHFNPNYKNRVWDNTTSRYLYINDSFPFNSYTAFNERHYTGYYSTKSINVKDNTRVSKLCRELSNKIGVFANTKEFKNNRELLEKLRNDKRNNFSDINNIETRYNTKLFERTANIEGSDATKMKDKYYALLFTEKDLDNQIKHIKKVSEYKGYKEYVAFINKNRDVFKEEYDSYRFWQPFLSFLYLLKFTLPLLFLSYLMYRYSNRINREKSIPIKLLKLVSSHIIFISILPIFFNTVFLIYSIIPHRFLGKVLAVLYEFGFVFLGYYFLMFVGVLFFGLMIFFIQKSAAKREKLRKELKEKTLYITSFNKGLCPNCKNKVNYLSQNFCGFCSEELNRDCESCKEQTPAHIQYCIKCGKE